MFHFPEYNNPTIPFGKNLINMKQKLKLYNKKITLTKVYSMPIIKFVTVVEKAPIHVPLTKKDLKIITCHFCPHAVRGFLVWLEIFDI